MFGDYRYERLISGEPTEKTRHASTTAWSFRPPGRLPNWSQYLKLLLIVALGCGLAYNHVAVVSSGSRRSHQTASKRSCGHSVAEALSNGCEFDILLTSWIPRQCRDYSTAAEFSDWIHATDRLPGPFPYFKDPGGMIRLENEDEVSRWTDVIYTTPEVYVVRCSMLGLHVHRRLLADSESGVEWQEWRAVDPAMMDQKECAGVVVDELGNRTSLDRWKSVSDPEMTLRVTFESC